MSIFKARTAKEKKIKTETIPMDSDSMPKVDGFIWVMEQSSNTFPTLCS